MTRNFVYSTISAASALLMLALLTLAGQRLGVDGFGAFTYAIAVATIAEVLMDFGLHQVTIRAIAQGTAPAGRYLATSMALKVIPGVVMVALASGAVWLLRAEPDVRMASFLMLLSATMRSYLLTARGILQGLERFGDDALVTVGDRALLVLACSAALVMGAGVVGVSAVFLATRAASAAGALALARSRGGHGLPDRDLARTLPREAFPVGLFLLVLNLYNRLDTVMLGSMLGLEANAATGRYGAAYGLYEGLTYATAIMSAVLAPRLSNLWVTDRPAYRLLVSRSLIGALVLALFVGGVGWMAADLGIHWLFGHAFEPAARTLRLLILGLPFIYVIWVLHAVALSSHHTSALVVVTAMGIGVNVALNLWLIPRYAENGAAVATAISEAAVMMLLLWRLRAAVSSPRG